MKRRYGFVSLAVLGGGTVGFWLGAISRQKLAAGFSWLHYKVWLHGEDEGPNPAWFLQ